MMRNIHFLLLNIDQSLIWRFSDKLSKREPYCNNILSIIISSFCFNTYLNDLLMIEICFCKKSLHSTFFFYAKISRRTNFYHFSWGNPFFKWRNFGIKWIFDIEKGFSTPDIYLNIFVNVCEGVRVMIWRRCVFGLYKNFPYLIEIYYNSG